MVKVTAMEEKPNPYQAPQTPDPLSEEALRMQRENWKTIGFIVVAALTALAALLSKR